MEKNKPENIKMDLKNNKELNELVKTFAVLNKDGIISTDDEFSTEDEEEDTEERFNFDNKSEISYKLPKIALSRHESVIGSGGCKTRSDASKDAAEAGAVAAIIDDSDNTTDDGYDTSEEAFDYFVELSDKYIDFTNENPTSFHVIHYFRTVLEAAGFSYFAESKSITQLKEENAFVDGGLYFTIRSDLSLVAFVVGGKWKPEFGVGAIGSHIDALTVKLKPNSTKSNIDGYNLLGVAPYSGTLNKLWLDRDLGIGGSILVNEGAKVTRKLVSSSPHPIAKIPSLAEHFGEIAEKIYNKETEMVPIVGHGSIDKNVTDEEKKSPLYGKHSIELLRYISRISDIPVSRILELDLELFDVQKAARGGLSKEFVFAPRLDDRLCSFSAIHGLVAFSKNLDSGSLKEFEGLNMVYLVDNEEIGSATRTGAKGKFMNSVIDKILSVKQIQSKDVVYANSIILSADVTHCLNPNFTEEYLANHYPVPNTGLTIKIDANQHVVTDSTGIVLLNKIAEKNGQKLQQFHIRNGAPSGSTIGPMLATDTGARVIDVGLPQLSMHSIRAMCGYKEMGLGVKIFNAFFQDWRTIYDEIDY